MKLPIRIEDIAEIDDVLYFFSRDFNGLYSLEKEETCIKKVCEIKNEKTYEERLYVKLGDEFLHKKFKFMSAHLMNEKIYMFSPYLSSIYCFDINTYVLQKIYEIDETILKEIVFDVSDSYFRKQVGCQDNRLYIPFCNANAILIYDVLKNRSEIKRIGNEKNGYSGIVISGNTVYCSPRKINMHGVKWNLINGDIEYLRKSSVATLGIYLMNGEFFYCSEGAYVFMKKDRHRQIAYDNARNQLIVWENSIVKNISFEIEMTIEDINRLNPQKNYKESFFMDLNKFIDIL